MRPILVFKNQDKVLLRCFSSLGIVTLCGIRLHVRDFPDTKASLVYLQSFLKCLSSRTDRELTLISTISLFTPPPIAHCRCSPLPPPPRALVRLHNFQLYIRFYSLMCLKDQFIQRREASWLLSSFMAHN